MRVETNIQRVKKSIEDERARYKLRSRNLAKKTAIKARDNVRSFISSPTFPGYAISGALAKKVVASEPVQVGNAFIAVARVQLTGKQKRYAVIHETGGRIEIKNPAQIRAMFASLRRYGQIRAGAGVKGRKLKYIKIKRKAYFAKGIEKTRREATAAKLRREF